MPFCSAAAISFAFSSQIVPRAASTADAMCFSASDFTAALALAMMRDASRASRPTLFMYVAMSFVIETL